MSKKASGTNKKGSKNKKRKVSKLSQMKKELKLNKIGPSRFTSGKRQSFIFEIEGKNIKLMSENAQAMEVSNMANLFKQLSKYMIKIMTIDEQVNLNKHIDILNVRDDLSPDETRLSKEIYKLYEGSNTDSAITMKKFYLVISGVQESAYSEIIDILTDSIIFYELSTLSTRLVVYNLMHRNGLGDKLFLEDNHEFPSLLKTTPDYIKLNNKFIKTIIVKDIPKEVNNVGIVNQVHDMKNVNSVIEMQASDTANFRKKLSAKKNYNLDQLNTKKLSDLDKYKLELENDYLNKAISHMTKENEVFFKFEVLFQITADTKKELDRLEIDLKSKLSSLNINCDELVLQQKEAFISMLPWCKSRVEWKLNSFSSSIASLYPQQVSSLVDDDGVYLGKSTSGEIIIIDLFSKYLSNPNLVVVGQSGNGKSIMLKKLIAGYSLKKDVKIFIFDSDQHEYVDVTNSCNGQIVSPGRENMINIFEIRKTGIDLMIDDMGEIIKQSANNQSTIMSHISWLKEFMRIYYPEITTNELIIFERLLIELYEQKGISEDVLHVLKSTDFPTVTDLWNQIVGLLEMGVEKIGDTPLPFDTLKNLQLKVSTMYNGSDSMFFNGYTTIETNSKVINFDILELQSRERRVQQAMLFTYINYIWDYIENPLNQIEKKILVIDELYLLVNKDNPMMVSYVTNIQKRNRKYSGALVCATQQLNDLNDPVIKSQTMSILSNPSLKIIHNVGEADSGLLKSHLLMKDHEIEKVNSFGKLNSLLKYNQQNFHLKTHILPTESEMFGRAGMSHRS